VNSTISAVFSESLLESSVTTGTFLVTGPGTDPWPLYIFIRINSDFYSGRPSPVRDIIYCHFNTAIQI
jgi:hypothetical protein